MPSIQIVWKFTYDPNHNMEPQRCLETIFITIENDGRETMLFKQLWKKKLHLKATTEQH